MKRQVEVGIRLKGIGEEYDQDYDGTSGKNRKEGISQSFGKRNGGK